MTPNDRQPQSDADLEPGADRFWGEFSRTRAGRSRSTEEETDDATVGEDRSDEPSGGPGQHGECLEWCPICRSAELIRTAVPPELRDQAEAIQREAVNVLKAFVSAYAERSASGSDTAAGGESPTAENPRSQSRNSGPDPADREPPAPRITDIPLD